MIGLSDEPYRDALKDYIPDCKKAQLRLVVSAVLSNSVQGRDLTLVRPPTRAVAAGSVIEMVCTVECARPGDVVRNVAYLCFAEAPRSGVLVVGDRVKTTRFSGVILGFNEAHAPNHINVVVGSERLVSGRSLGLAPGDRIVIAARDYE